MKALRRTLSLGWTSTQGASAYSTLPMSALPASALPVASTAAGNTSEHCSSCSRERDLGASSPDIFNRQVQGGRRRRWPGLGTRTCRERLQGRRQQRDIISFITDLDGAHTPGSRRQGQGPEALYHHGRVGPELPIWWWNIKQQGGGDGERSRGGSRRLRCR